MPGFISKGIQNITDLLPLLTTFLFYRTNLSCLLGVVYYRKTMIFNFKLTLKGTIDILVKSYFMWLSIQSLKLATCV